MKEILFRGVLRRHVSQNVDAITGTLWLNRFDIADSHCCMYLIDRFSQLLRCEVALHFINTWDINDLPFDYLKQLQLLVWRYVCGCVCRGSFVIDCHALHGPMENTSLQIELAYLFSKFCSLGNVYLFFILTSSLMFPWCRWLEVSIFASCMVFPLIVQDCLKLQPYCLDIIRDFHFWFVNCKAACKRAQHSQHCCANNVGSCCVRVGSGVQTDGT